MCEVGSEGGLDKEYCNCGKGMVKKIISWNFASRYMKSTFVFEMLRIARNLVNGKFQSDSTVSVTL